MDQRKTYQKNFEVFRFKPTLRGKAEGEGCEIIHYLANSQGSFSFIFFFLLSQVLNSETGMIKGPTAPALGTKF